MGTRKAAAGFTFDGHPFLVVDLGDEGTFVYDVLTRQWTRFQSGAVAGQWDFTNAYFWSAGYRTVGGRAATTAVAVLDPAAHSDYGADNAYVVTGMIPSRKREMKRVHALQVVGAIAHAAGAGATMELKVSDNNGESYVSAGAKTVPASALRWLEWLHLGALKPPGKIFRLESTGGLVRIDGAEAVVERDPYAGNE